MGDLGGGGFLAYAGCLYDYTVKVLRLLEIKDDKNGLNIFLNLNLKYFNTL